MNENEEKKETTVDSLPELEANLLSIVRGYDLSIDERLDRPDWDIENWTERIPKRLRELWDDLSRESKLVALIVGTEGAQPPWDIE